MTTTLTLFSPSGVVARATPLRRAARRLQALGFDVDVDLAALLKQQRFAGDDATRLAALHRIATAAPDIAMASRGGYGLGRLLDRVDWKLLAGSVERGTRWVGHSDMTALQLGLLARVQGAGAITWAGPMACYDFGRTATEAAATDKNVVDAVDDVMQDCFVEAMHGQLEAIGFRTTSGFDGLGVRGTLWGGNLCVLNSLLGTPHMPRIRGGVLFLEDVNEHPYRIERSLLQLQQAGVLDAQKAVLLGAFTGWRRSPLDRGYDLKAVIEHLRSRCAAPILTGLPFGHVPTKVTMPIGMKVELLVQRRDVLVGW